MLSNTIMGIFALGVSWLTALLVALDLGIDLRALARKRRAFAGSTFVGTVVSDEIASHEIEQRVRRLDAATPALGYWDRSHTSRLVGGKVNVDGSELTVEPEPDATVWTSLDEKRRAALLDGPAFDALYAEAKSARGALRVVKTTLARGARVWLVGSRSERGLAVSLAASFDPSAWCRARSIRTWLVVLLDVAWVLGGTALALTAPHFGVVSTLGAVVLIGHFLGITPIAVSIREGNRDPALEFLRGRATRDRVVEVAARRLEATST